MHGSDRSKGATSLIAGGFSALFLLGVAVLIYPLAFLSGRQAERRQQAPASYSQSAQADAERACARLKGSAAFECIYEKVESAQEQARAEQDLSAQQLAANSAFASALVSLLTLIVTGIGVWFVKRTLDATLKAVEDTGEATQAMLRQNQLSEVSQRAWIYIDRVNTLTAMDSTANGGAPEEILVFDIIMQNFGATPAVNIASGHTFVMIERNHPSPDIRAHHPDEGSGAVGPGQTFEVHQFALGRDNLRQFRGGERDIFIAITCAYFDVFSDFADLKQRRETVAGIRLSHGGRGPMNDVGVRPDLVRVQTGSLGQIIR